LLNKFNKFNRKKDTLNRPASESYLQSTLVVVKSCNGTIFQATVVDF
jgi:hypothetical protein